MKRMLTISFLALILSTALFADWTYDSDFVVGKQPHAAVVDANGRIWVGYYAYSDTLGLPNDTIPIKPIYVYEPDGTQASFSPIRTISWSDGRVDTMWNGCRGISLDHNGNVLYSAYNDVWQINYQTGEGIGALYDFPGSLTEAATTPDGYMFITMVVPSGNPIWVFDASLDLPNDYTGAAVDWSGLVNTLFDGENNAISRTLIVNNAGTEIYHGRIYGGTHNNGVFHYVGTDPEGTWLVEDILYKEVMWGQILDWGPDSTIWVGTYWDVAEGDFTGYYEIDPGANHQLVGSIGTGQPYGVSFNSSAVAQGDTIRAPRGITFSADGNTAYVCDFDGSRVLKFTYDATTTTVPPYQDDPSFAGWTYDSDFVVGKQPHAAVVDANGRIWVGYYAYSDTLGLPNDTIPIKPIYVYEPDGTQASFSPIRTISWSDGRVDTMWNGCRGISLDHNGNVLYSAYNDVWQINYQTGEGIGALYDFPGSLTEAATTPDGYMFITMVVPSGNPIWVFDASLDLPNDYTGAAVDWSGLVNTLFDGENNAISRTLIVNNAGTEIYHGRIYGGTHNNGVFHYVGTDPEGTWLVEDILYKEVMWGQILDWGPDSTIWVGTYWDVAEGDFTGYYEIDPGANHQLVGSIGTGQPYGVSFNSSAVAQGDTIRAPRGITFSADGNTAYVCDFDGSRVLKFTAALSTDDNIAVVPSAFNLYQNYPNPFNPTTNIEFELYTSDKVKLVVYNVMGREVATLVNGVMPVGHHVVQFNANGLASGMYIYTLTNGQSMVTKRMLLVK
ncbi:MAG: SMP-30/gluconolactonase/LRE family protein [Fidelibacterota bacterium]